MDLNSSKLVVRLTSSVGAADCPLCQTASRKVHSYYTRHLKDLPWADFSLDLELQVRRFYCSSAQCPKITFAERLGREVEAYARRTTRLNQKLQHLALDLGGEGGAELALKWGIKVSPDTLLRLIAKVEVPQLKTPRVLGVDDFAWRKGQRYGTILLNLETHQPIELLADREMQTFATWLMAHPGVEVISRDRSNSYSEAARLAAPEAIQVADRFHIYQNLGETLERIVRRHYAQLRPLLEPIFKPAAQPLPPLATSLPEAAAPIVREGFSPLVPTKATEPRLLKAEPLELKYWEKRKAANQQQRLERYQQVQALAAQGLKQTQIAQQLGMGHKTVRQLLKRAPQPPVYKARMNKLDPYKAYLEGRFSQEGVDNAKQLYREIVELGYTGCSSVVSAYVTQLRPLAEGIELTKKRVRTLPKAETKRLPSARQIRWWLSLKPERLNEKQRQALALICQQVAELGESYRLTQTFISMMGERQAAGLTQWISTAQCCGVDELESLARGLAQDEAAVRAGISLPWSQGPVEGTINRLKLLKRAMYGRASFKLLRQRFLAA
ncbi:MAG TPA: ISL3 family transposase [Chloroflexia bacterium]|nr:ISL3 family transposase [Chloroflexia bacterium]